jgi:secondary thiamine-phosphate synthase enzyme
MRDRTVTTGAVTRQALAQIDIRTQGAGLVEITDPVRAFVTETGIMEGVLVVFIRHTSASLVIQENADPDVRSDIDRFFTRLVPWDETLYRHASEGPDDMPAHIRSALTQTSLSIPVAGGRPLLGSWQGIYLFEHRARAHLRHVVLHLMGA